MNLLGSFVIAFSMYSKIPMPQLSWTRERMKYALCFFPLIGVVIGVCLYGFLWLSGRMGLSRVFIACLGTAVPLLITGGIHMDGYLDVADARSSYQDRERKLEIMKDPHTGAFAVIKTGVYLLFYCGFLAELPLFLAPAFGVCFVAARALSGLAVVRFPKAKDSGLAAAFSGQAQKAVVTAVMAGYLAVCFFVLLAMNALLGSCLAAVAALTFAYYYWMAKKEFGGITGDLAGYFLQVCELAMLMTICVFGWGVG